MGKSHKGSHSTPPMPEPTEVTTGQVATWLNVHEGTEDALLLADSDGECGLFTIRGHEADIAPGELPLLGQDFCAGLQLKML